MSVILKEYIKKNNLSVLIQGKDYTMVEGYAFAGMLLGFTPRIASVEKLAENKWMAKTEIFDRQGSIVSIGYALCSKEEMKKKSYDEYAILSMAQTRSLGKAYRNLIGWVMKMSGFESTPAEEINPVAVDKMVEDASAKILACTNPVTLEEYAGKIQGSKKYSAEQKKDLENLIKTQMEFIHAKESK